jgi:predicted nucleic acid-binding protein
MSRAFVDTSFFVALLNPRDQLHPLARRIAAGWDRPMLTTTAVITELANFLCHGPNRTTFLHFLADLRADPQVEICHADEALFDRATGLFASRPDKSWSLTDCISFVLMNERGVRDALTADHHFDQAGFRSLLRGD